MDDNETKSNLPFDTEGEDLFEETRVIDQEWAEFSLTTTSGNYVTYRIPRKTLFDEIDEAIR
jgi:hypothetical protein